MKNKTAARGNADFAFAGLALVRDSIVIVARAEEPGIDLRNVEVFDRTLFSRDDQALQQLNAASTPASTKAAARRLRSAGSVSISTTAASTAA